MQYKGRTIKMNTVYLQCDCRYNKWLLKNIGEGG